jgi:hypothetical protein
VLLLSGIASRKGASAQIPQDLFPIIKGWTLTTDDPVYDPGTLWDYIDGAADLYLLCGFVDLHIARYRSGEGKEIRVEVYRHSTRENAFGIYSQERNTDYRFVDVGTQGYEADGVVNFLAGIYYVKVAESSPGTGDRSQLLQTARGMEKELGQARGWPLSLSFFPDSGRVGNSDQFIPSEFLGYSFFRSAYTARYDGGLPLMLFVMEAASDEAASAAVEAYRRTLHAGAYHDNEGVLLVRDPHHGPLVIGRVGRHVYGGVGTSELVSRCDELRKHLAMQQR